ncbi:MAG TPA: bifunctional phosphoglucose/phosphomannose isomerase [Candidatus Limnocylindrales bacterium]|nr:bifunctional phosphoglucose/phosphomannose isomerase [Candidatus Limnocylindrales bacterium]
MTTTQEVSNLDDAGAVRRRDPGGMLGHAGAFGAQLRAGWEISRSLTLGDLHRSAKSVAVLGMGGSAAAGDLVRGIFSDRLTVPIVAVRDYELPAWVGRETLVVAASHSGSTEETISALGAALERRCPVIAMTTGGPIGDVAARVGLPRLVFPNETPPRASLGYTLMLLAGLLERAGMLTLDDAEIEAAVAAADAVAASCGPEKPTESNLAKQIAWSVLDRLPIIEGSGFLAAVARRWKTQLNENSNSIAVAEELPEAMHNTVVGYDQPDALRDHQYVLFLKGDADHARNAARAALSVELLDAVSIAHQTVVIEGDGRLAQAVTAISLGDYVSCYLGLLYGMDPSATPVLTHVKQRMAELGQDD